MFGIKKKKQYKKKYQSQKTSRVDKIINILEAADRKDKAEGNGPKRKYVKKKKDPFQIGW
jgi:hypothetical protein